MKKRACRSHLVRLICAATALSILLPVAVWAEVPYQTLWVKQFGSASWDQVSGVAADGSGNVFVTGYTEGALEEGKANAGGQDIFLVKFSAATGQKLWVKQLGTAERDQAFGVAVDGTGNVFVTGGTGGSLEEGKANAGDLDMFVAKFSAATGAKLWVKQFGSVADIGSGITVDRGGDVFITGYKGTWQAVVAKFSATSGDLLWAKEFGSATWGEGIAVDGSGNIFVSGRTYGSLEEGKDAGDNEDCFLAKFSAVTGERLWVKQFGTALNDVAHSVAVDTAGGVFVTGETVGSLEEGKGTVGYQDLFLAKFSAGTGDKIWLKQVGSIPPVAPDSGQSVAVDETGNVFVVGYTWGVLEAGKTSNENGGSDFFLAKFNGASGEELWAKQFGSADPSDYSDTWGNGVAVGGNGDVFATGYTYGSVETGKANAGDIDSFVAKFGAAKTPQEQITQIIGDLDKGVAAGSIKGSSNGNSADGTVNALRNMLRTVGNVIAGGKAAKACGQLKEIYIKLDGLAVPPDFIQGDGVAQLAAEIATLENSLGCK